MDERQKLANFSLRPFKPGDEATLVDFLNLCFSGSSQNKEHWEWAYPRDPFFDRSNIFVIESNNQIIGHRSLHPRQLIIRGKKVPTAFLGATAIHPSYRGQGLYTRLHQATLNAARSRGVCLALTRNSRGSITYNHNKKTGFIEIAQSPTYIKPINYEKFFKGEVSGFIARRGKLKSIVQGFETNLYLHFGDAEFSLLELLSEDNPTAAVSDKKGEVRIILAKNSLPLLVKFLVSGKLQKMKCLLLLLLSRKMKIRFSSFLALAKVVRVGIRAVKYV